MYTNHKRSIYTDRSNSQLKNTRRKHFFYGTPDFNYHGLNNKTFLRVLPCLAFAFAIMLALALVTSYTKHHSYYLQEDASVQMTKFAAKNEIFSEQADTFEVSVIMANHTITVPTAKTSVTNLLAELNIDMTERESDLAPDTELSHAATIHLYDVNYQITTQTEIIPYETEIVDVSTIPYGTTRVVQKGVNGTLTRTVKNKIVDGKLTGQTVTSDKRIEPTKQIIQKGIGGYYTGDDGVTYHYSHYIDVQATAYTAPESARTASGEPVGMNVIAVDPSVIALGTKVYVASDYYDCGVRTALDTGGAIKGKIIDVFMGTDDAAYQQALKWGRRSARVYFLVDDE